MQCNIPFLLGQRRVTIPASLRREPEILKICGKLAVLLPAPEGAWLLQRSMKRNAAGRSLSCRRWRSAFPVRPGQTGQVPVARPPHFHRLRFRGCSGQARYGSVMQDRPPKDLAPIAASLVFAGVLVLFVILGVVLAIAL